MRKLITGKQFDEERALYNLKQADVNQCVFAGPADGESALKEARDVCLHNCSFSLRLYPLCESMSAFFISKIAGYASMPMRTIARLTYFSSGSGLSSCPATSLHTASVVLLSNLSRRMISRASLPPSLG